MSDTSDDTSSDALGSLYNPPSPSSPPEEQSDDQIPLQVSLSPEQADRLRSVAQQLGLPPALVARRAIEVVCDEVVTIQEDPRSKGSLIDQYQARLDLLHSVESLNGETSATQAESS